MNKFLFLVKLIIVLICLNGCKSKNIPPQKRIVTIVTSDIDNFWDAFHKTKGVNDTVHFYEYFENASPGLEDFANYGLISHPKKGKGKVIEMTNAAINYKNFYTSIESNTKEIALLSDSIDLYCSKLQDLYPVEAFPTVYFIMGLLGAGGTASENGLILSAEMLCVEENTVTEELNENIIEFLKSKEYIPSVTIHELIHFLQPSRDSVKTVLDCALIEGGADFITDLVVGKLANDVQHSYGNDREEIIWNKFKNDIDSTNLGLWFYNHFDEIDCPPDLGYFVGYKICESYYDNSTDKSKAIKDIIEIEDFKNFLTKSGYREKFENVTQ